MSDGSDLKDSTTIEEAVADLGFGVRIAQTQSLGKGGRKKKWKKV